MGNIARKIYGGLGLCQGPGAPVACSELATLVSVGIPSATGHPGPGEVNVPALQSQAQVLSNFSSKIFPSVFLQWGVNTPVVASDTPARDFLH